MRRNFFILGLSENGYFLSVQFNYTLAKNSKVLVKSYNFATDLQIKTHYCNESNYKGTKKKATTS